MSYGTYTTTESKTFTVTHAVHIAVKIGTDLKRMQRFYGKPTDERISDYEKEAIVLLKDDYLSRIEYGFKSNDETWRIALKYEARRGGVLIADDDPGGIRPCVDVTGCKFHSFLVTNHRWSVLSKEDKDLVYKKAGISFKRSEGTEPSGNWVVDRVYSAGGRGVQRSSLY